MEQDIIVDEIRTIRANHAAQFNFDLHAIYLDLKKREGMRKQRKVSFAPKRPFVLEIATVEQLQMVQ